jgi:hypothetical protein
MDSSRDEDLRPERRSSSFVTLLFSESVALFVGSETLFSLSSRLLARCASRFGPKTNPDVSNDVRPSTSSISRLQIYLGSLKTRRASSRRISFWVPRPDAAVLVLFGLDEVMSCICSHYSVNGGCGSAQIASFTLALCFMLPFQLQRNSYPTQLKTKGLLCPNIEVTIMRAVFEGL